MASIIPDLLLHKDVASVVLVVVVRERTERHAYVVITRGAVSECNLEGVVREQAPVVRASAVQRAVGSCEVAAGAAAVGDGT